MTTDNIRQKLHDFITDADDEKIEGVYQILESEISKNGSFILTEEQIGIVDEERQKHQHRESKSYTWEEAKEIIRANKADA